MQKKSSFIRCGMCALSKLLQSTTLNEKQPNQVSERSEKFLNGTKQLKNGPITNVEYIKYDQVQCLGSR